MNAEVARAIIALEFSADHRQEMARLAERVRQGTLTPEEREAIDSYERAGHCLSVLKSKAHLVLKSEGSRAETRIEVM